MFPYSAELVSKVRQFIKDGWGTIASWGTSDTDIRSWLDIYEPDIVKFMKTKSNLWSIANPSLKPGYLPTLNLLIEQAYSQARKEKFGHKFPAGTDFGKVRPDGTLSAEPAAVPVVVAPQIVTVKNPSSPSNPEKIENTRGPIAEILPVPVTTPVLPSSEIQLNERESKFVTALKLLGEAALLFLAFKRPQLVAAIIAKLIYILTKYLKIANADMDGKEVKVVLYPRELDDVDWFLLGAIGGLLGKKGIFGKALKGIGRLFGKKKKKRKKKQQAQEAEAGQMYPGEMPPSSYQAPYQGFDPGIGSMSPQPMAEPTPASSDPFLTPQSVDPQAIQGFEEMAGEWPLPTSGEPPLIDEGALRSVEGISMMDDDGFVG